MREKPILFNTEMVMAILDGRKTQTRRVIKPQPTDCTKQDGIHWKGKAYGIKPDGSPFLNRIIEECPYGQPGDILWVRETWGRYSVYNGVSHAYKADCVDAENLKKARSLVKRWRPSIHMPRELARIFLKVTDVRVERLQKITANDVIAEGIQLSCKHVNYMCSAYPCVFKETNACKDKFVSLWDSTIKKQDLDKYSWDANPWVWVIDFSIK